MFLYTRLLHELESYAKCKGDIKVLRIPDFKVKKNFSRDFSPLLFTKNRPRPTFGFDIESRTKKTRVYWYLV